MKRRVLTIILSAIACSNPLSAATILFDEHFASDAGWVSAAPISGTRPADWDLVAVPSDASIGWVSNPYSPGDGYLTMTSCTACPFPQLVLLRNNVSTFDASTPDLKATMTTSIVSFTGTTNVTGMGQSNSDIGWSLSDTGTLTVSATNGSTIRFDGLTTNISGYSGGPIEVTLSVDVNGYQVRTNTGYDSGLRPYTDFANGFTFATLPTNSAGIFGVIFANHSSEYDRVQLVTAVGADAQTISTNTVQSTTNATTTLTVSGSGDLNQTGGTTKVLETITIEAGGVYTLSGGTLEADEIVVNPGGQFVLDGGTLAANSVQGDITNPDGTISPGNSPGTTTITGDYSQSASGELLIELAGMTAGNEYDEVIVGGAASLGGTLDVDFLYGFLPEVGDFFDILQAESISGSFDLLDIPSTEGIVWQLQNLTDFNGSTDVLRLTAAAATVPVPAAAWLFGSALGLVGFLRRRMR